MSDKKKETYIRLGLTEIIKPVVHGVMAGRTVKKIMEFIVGIQAFPNGKTCHITNGQHSWIMDVDGRSISFVGHDNAEYLRDLYQANGYHVIFNSLQDDTYTLSPPCHCGSTRWKWAPIVGARCTNCNQVVSPKSA